MSLLVSFSTNSWDVCGGKDGQGWRGCRVWLLTLAAALVIEQLVCVSSERAHARSKSEATPCVRLGAEAAGPSWAELGPRPRGAQPPSQNRNRRSKGWTRRITSGQRKHTGSCEAMFSWAQTFSVGWTQDPTAPPILKQPRGAPTEPSSLGSSASVCSLSNFTCFLLTAAGGSAGG